MASLVLVNFLNFSHNVENRDENPEESNSLEQPTPSSTISPFWKSIMFLCLPVFDFPRIEQKDEEESSKCDYSQKPTKPSANWKGVSVVLEKDMM